MARRPLRILYVSGAGDVVGTYRHWLAGRDDPSQVAKTYSGQFFDLCRRRGFVGKLVSPTARVDSAAGDGMSVENRPVKWQRRSAVLFHLGQLWYGLRLVTTAVRFRADLAVVAVGGTHWFVLGLMRPFGIAVVPTLHCVLWPKHRKPSGRVGRTVHALDRRFFRRRASAALSLSDDITTQLREMLGGVPLAVFPFLPTYRPETFGDGYGPPPPPPPFNVLYVGRIERNKGVFDLLDAAKQLPADFAFDLCGDGSQLPALRQAAADAGLADRFRLHGHTNYDALRQRYEQCHAVVVPTTTAFIEGLNKVVVEGVLAGRPVVTSSVCPALEYVRGAVVEVPPDDVGAYADALLRLRTDPALYAAKRAATAGVRAMFYDPARGWAAALERAADRVRPPDVG